MKQPELKLNVELEQKAESPVRISLLINSIYYFIESVFIMTVKEGYRLVIIHQCRLLTDEIYKTARGARIAFAKRYGNKAWRVGVKAEWSRFYPPERNWLDDKFREKKRKK
ncbi:MAG: hypothetical protein QG657_4127 [Acidobacteriota bacterium]|nr:hypothetical protein [Acidobacteriota bacterium]